MYIKSASFSALEVFHLISIKTFININNLRLWDAVGGFLFLFSHMQDKLSKHSSQVDLLKELLNLQKDMITMMLSMLEGNVVNGIGIISKY